jgi:two-component system cell cycle response regulator DivK
LAQRLSGLDQRARLDPKRFGGGDQVGLVGEEEVDSRHQNGRSAKAAAQFVGGEPGQREEAVRPRIVGDDPGHRLHCQDGGIDFGGFRIAQNCQGLMGGIERPGMSARPRLQVAKRILVVEDNDLNRKLFCDVLKSQGFAVEPVADGNEALERARQFVPNLIIMDIQLPNVSGLDLIEAAKGDSTLRSIPVLAVTAYAGKGDEERIREAGAEAYLAKPVSIGPFMNAVRSLIA